MSDTSWGARPATPAAPPEPARTPTAARPAQHADRPEMDIPFGDLPNQVMPASWATAMLRKFYARDRTKFGKYLNEWITVDMPAMNERNGADR